MPGYKYCIVPKCVNTTYVTPNKLFFVVPKKAKTRVEWCKIMKRNDKTPLSNKSSLHCCEDHFDVETDMKDYTKFKKIGGPLRLKKGVVPHKFDCQKMQRVFLMELSAFKKQKQIESFEKALNSNICPENLLEVPIEFIKSEPIDADESDPVGDNDISIKLEKPNELDTE